MSTTQDRISKEQLHQTFFPLSDDSFESGKLYLGEHVQCVAGTLTGDATYVLNLAPAGVAEGCMCSITLNVGEDSTLTVKDGPNVLFNAVTNDSIYAVLFCDGISWHVVWDRNVMVALHARIPVPEGGAEDQLLAKASATDGDVEWQTIHKIPAGGTEDQLLAKASATDGDVEWQTVPKIPAGGTTGQVLAKKSETDFDLEWITP